MTYFTRFVLACTIVLLVVPVVAAQQTATPVVRIGDWVEIGNEVFMNIIATTDIRYRTTKDYDFESRIDDRVNSRSNLDTVPHGGEGDLMFAESRLGVDMRYQKSLQMQVLFEQQSIFDGNLIDNNPDNPGCGITGNPPCRTGPPGPAFPGPAEERNTVNLERFWIDYKFPGTPLRMRVGADLWRTDLAGINSDDDPRFALFYDGNPVKAYAAAVIQTESSRLGLTDDNDYIYYTFGVSFDLKPHRFAIDAAYFRDRASGAIGQPLTRYGQQFDTVLISPSWQGSLGPINAMLQGSFHIGTADGTLAAGRREFDVWNWAAIAYLDVDLGIVKPFVAFIYGTGDDNPNDLELNGFALPHNEITIISGHPFFDTFDTSTSWGERGTAAPARAGYAGGAQFRHTVGNPFSDRIGNLAHRDRNNVVRITSSMSNPGVVMPMAGIKASPLKGHDVDVWWIWTRLDTLETLQAAALQALPATVVGADRRRFLAAVRDFDENLTHEFSIAYTWTLNPHFDIRLTGNIIIPLDGAKAIARTQDCEAAPGLQPCEGEDIALRGEARFRARF
jgi:hypothetical protein